MKKIVIWGASGQLLVLKDFIEEIGYKIIALFDNNKDLLSPIDNIPLYYGKEQFIEWHIKNHYKRCFFAVAIGGWKGKDRIQIHEFLKSYGLIPASIVHPTAFVSPSARIGQGCQILGKSFIGANSTMGKQIIVNTGASIDHECKISDGVHIAPGAILTGVVSVGNNSFIGAGSVVLPRITIGRNVIIGAGSVVTKNIPDNVIAYGNPARIKRENISAY